MISNPCLLTAEHKAAVSVLKIITSHSESSDDEDDKEHASRGGASVKEAAPQAEGAGLAAALCVGHGTCLPTNEVIEEKEIDKQSRSAVCSMSVKASDRYLAKLLKRPEV